MGWGNEGALKPPDFIHIFWNSIKNSKNPICVQMYPSCIDLGHLISIRARPISRTLKSEHCALKAHDLSLSSNLSDACTSGSFEGGKKEIDIVRNIESRVRRGY